MMNKNEMIQEIYTLLQDRLLHPSGRFEGGTTNRWYAENSDLINVRSPSRAYPYSQMIACRTKKYVTKVCEKFDCKTLLELRNAV